jgi:hypothetical protein
LQAVQQCCYPIKTSLAHLAWRVTTPYSYDSPNPVSEFPIASVEQ